MKKPYNLKVLETTLYISGLECELTLFQVTDLHFIYTDENDGKEINDLRERYSQWFSNGPAVAEEIIKLFKCENPDMVVFTGDISGYPTNANICALRNFLQECPQYLFVFGNHERIFTIDDLPRKRMERFTPMYDFALKGDSELQVIEKAGIYLVGIDNSDNQITPSQLDRLKQLFKTGKPCLLFFHIPMYVPELLVPVTEGWGAPLLFGVPKGTDVKGDSTLIPTEATEEFVRLLTTQDTPVSAMFAGHIHFFDRSDEFYPQKRQIITPMANMPDKGIVRKIKLIPKE